MGVFYSCGTDYTRLAFFNIPQVTLDAMASYGVSMLFAKMSVIFSIPATSNEPEKSAQADFDGFAAVVFKTAPNEYNKAAVCAAINEILVLAGAGEGVLIDHLEFNVGLLKKKSPTPVGVSSSTSPPKKQKFPTPAHTSPGEKPSVGAGKAPVTGNKVPGPLHSVTDVMVKVSGTSSTYTSIAVCKVLAVATRVTTNTVSIRVEIRKGLGTADAVFAKVLLTTIRELVPLTDNSTYYSGHYTLESKQKAILFLGAFLGIIPKSVPGLVVVGNLQEVLNA